MFSGFINLGLKQLRAVGQIANLSRLPGGSARQVHHLGIYETCSWGEDNLK